MNEKEKKRISKFLSLVLRHKPETIALELDASGWADVGELIEKSNTHGVRFDMEGLKDIVATHNKKRFAFNEDFTEIRASQGHSINVELGYANQEPSEFLYHGTAQRFADSILAEGLQKKGRQHVHLSTDMATATQVGQRHGKPIVFKVLAQQMFEDGHEFFLSENAVWLTEHVPTRYLREGVS